MPEISVIMPMYNAAKTVTYSIDAILNQTFKDVEVIVVDDCSPDNELEICREKYKDEPRVVLLKQDKNQGPAAARNRGIEEAKGNYITFLDSDDGMKKEGLEKMYEIAIKYDADVVHSTGRFLPVHKPEVVDMMSVPDDYCIEQVKDAGTGQDPELLDQDYASRLKGWTTGQYNGNVWGKLIKRQFLMDNDIRFAHLKMSEDVLFSFECLMRAERYVKFPYSFIIYRLIGDSLSKGKKDIPFMIKLLESTLGGDDAFGEKMDKIPFFMEHPEYKSQVFEYIDNAMDSLYITPCYQIVGEEALRNDPRIHKIFEKYFGTHAAFMERYFYIKQNAEPETPDVLGESLTYENCLKMLEDYKNGKSKI